MRDCLFRERLELERDQKYSEKGGFDFAELKQDTRFFVKNGFRSKEELSRLNRRVKRGKNWSLDPMNYKQSVCSKASEATKGESILNIKVLEQS